MSNNMSFPSSFFVSTISTTTVFYSYSVLISFSSMGYSAFTVLMITMSFLSWHSNNAVTFWEEHATGRPKHKLYKLGTRMYTHSEDTLSWMACPRMITGRFTTNTKREASSWFKPSNSSMWSYCTGRRKLLANVSNLSFTSPTPYSSERLMIWSINFSQKSWASILSRTLWS